MNILSPKYPGRIAICSFCGALLSYNDNDVYDNIIYCPLCRQPTKIDYDKNYDGVIIHQDSLEENA